MAAVPKTKTKLSRKDTLMAQFVLTGGKGEGALAARTAEAEEIAKMVENINKYSFLSGMDTLEGQVSMRKRLAGNIQFFELTAAQKKSGDYEVDASGSWVRSKAWLNKFARDQRRKLKIAFHIIGQPGGRAVRPTRSAEEIADAQALG
ncbi:MAG: hypothetical protein AB7G06_08205 [Bdellovibrionales bacterium]